MTTQPPEDLARLTDRALDARLMEAVAAEKRLSERRGKLQDRLDFLRSGGAGSEASEQLLAKLTTDEREVSAERKAMHRLIDLLRAERSGRETPVTTVEQRLRRLEDEREILDTLYAYGHAIDYGLREEWIGCWTETAVLRWPHVTLTGHEEIGAAFDDHSHAPEAYHKHFVVEPRIRVDGDRATVDSYFTRIDAGPTGPYLRSFGRYRDVLARCPDGRWRIQERVAERESLVAGARLT